jgi:hypothetical protein
MPYDATLCVLHTGDGGRRAPFRVRGRIPRWKGSEGVAHAVHLLEGKRLFTGKFMARKITTTPRDRGQPESAIARSRAGVRRTSDAPPPGSHVEA